jgi:hypothetical protein
MTHSFYMPTRVASGPGTLANIGAVARDLGLFDVLLVSDSVISRRISTIAYRGTRNAGGYGLAALPGNTTRLKARCAAAKRRLVTSRQILLEVCDIDPRARQIDDQASIACQRLAAPAGDPIAAYVTALRRLYEDIGFPSHGARAGCRVRASPGSQRTRCPGCTRAVYQRNGGS